MTGVSCLDASRKNGQHPWSLKLECSETLPELKDLNSEQRKAFIKEDIEFMPDGALGLVVADGEPVAVIKILRDEALLAKSVICVSFHHRGTIPQAMLRMINATNLDLVLLNTAGYAYEPVLGRLQETTEIPFERELLFWDDSQILEESEAYKIEGTSAKAHTPHQALSTQSSSRRVALTSVTCLSTKENANFCSIRSQEDCKTA